MLSSFFFRHQNTTQAYSCLLPGFTLIGFGPFHFVLSARWKQVNGLSSGNAGRGVAWWGVAGCGLAGCGLAGCGGTRIATAKPAGRYKTSRRVAKRLQLNAASITLLLLRVTLLLLLRLLRLQLTHEVQAPER